VEAHVEVKRESELWKLGVWVGHSADCFGARGIEGCAIIAGERRGYGL
jgi:hypothetical protein